MVEHLFTIVRMRPSISYLLSKGKTAKDLKKLQSEEQNIYPMFGYLDRDKIDVWMTWTNLEYAYRDPFSKRLCDKVQQFMNKLSAEIRKRIRDLNVGLC